MSKKAELEGKKKVDDWGRLESFSRLMLSHIDPIHVVKSSLISVFTLGSFAKWPSSLFTEIQKKLIPASTFFSSFKFYIAGIHSQFDGINSLKSR